MCVVDGDNALANVAGAVGDDSGGGKFNVTVPCLARFRVPNEFSPPDQAPTDRSLARRSRLEHAFATSPPYPAGLLQRAQNRRR